MEQKKSKTTTYDKGSELPGTIPGILYQLELSMLFLKRGLENKYSTFYLATEMKEAGKFDDLVFEYTDKVNRIKYRFLQIKHITYKQITVNELLKGVGAYSNEFGLAKYFLSYLKIKHDPIFQKGSLEDLVICTNTGFEFERSGKLKTARQGSGKGKTFYFKEITDPDAMFVLGGKRYQLIKKDGDGAEKFKDIFGKALKEEVENLGQKINRATNSEKKEKAEKLKEALEEIIKSRTALEKSIEEFLDKLIFSVNQPNQNELAKLIDDSIRREFVLTKDETKLIYANLQKEFLDWLREKEGRFLSKDDDFFKEGAQILARVILNSQTSTYLTKLGKFGITFEDRVVQATGLQTFLNSGRQIFNITSLQATWLSSIKISQDLNKRKVGSHICLNSKFFLDLKLQDRVSRAFESKKVDLLAIECDIVLDETEVQNALIKLVDIIKNNLNKKIVLITREDDSLGNFLATLKRNRSDINYLNAQEKNSLLSYLDKLIEDNIRADRDRQYIKVSKDESKLSDCDTESRATLLGKTVIFQGKEVSLGELIGIKDSSNLLKERLNRLDEVILGSALVELIQEDKIKVGSLPLRLPVDQKHYYIERAFNKITVKADFENGNEKFFSICDITKDLSAHSPKIEQEIILIDNTEESFKGLCQDYPQHVIHWLKKEDENLIWQQSQGSLSALRVYLDNNEENTSSYGKNELPEYIGRVAIIADKPGMGKSTLLTHLLEKTPESKWVIKVNLEEQREQLKKLVDNHKKLDEIGNVVEFLSGIDTYGIKTVLATKLLQYYLNSGSIVLFFDSFNEIKPQYQEKIVQLIKFLKDKTKSERIWIATRSHRQDYLEKAVDILAHTLKPLDDVEQIEFLQRFWIQDLNLKGNKIGNIRELSIAIAIAVNQLEAESDEKIGKNINQDLISAGPETVEDVARKLKKVVSLIGNLKETNKLVDKLEKTEDLANTLKQVRDLAEKINKIVNLIMEPDDPILNEDEVNKRINSYAKELIIYFPNVIREIQKSQFVGIPLQIRMLAEAFSKQFKEFFWLSEDKPKISRDLNINILDLYQLFIQRKYDIYFEQKVQFGDLPPFLKISSIREFTKAHRRLAVNVLFPEKKDLLLQGGAETIPFKYEALREHGEEELKQVGIVQVTNTEFHFIHRTFAEYLVADLLTDKLSKKKSNPTTYNNAITFLKEQLFEEENDVMRYFLDQRLAQGHKMHRAILQDDETEFKKLLSDNADYYVHEIDNLGRMPLHLAVSYNHNEIVDKLIKKSSLSISVLDTLGEYPLSYAVFLKGSYNPFSKERNLIILILKESETSEGYQKILNAAFKRVVQRAGSKGFFILDLLFEYVNANQKQAMLVADNYIAIKKAVQQSNSRIIKSLLYQADVDQRQAMINSINYVETFKEALQHGYTNIASSLLEHADAGQRKAMVNSVGCREVFRAAIESDIYDGSIIIGLFLDYANLEQQQAMVSTNDYFKEAVQRGYLRVSKIIFDFATAEQRQAMVNSIDYIATFKDAVQRNDDMIVRCLYEYANVDQQQAMMRSIDSVAIKKEVQHKEFWIAVLLLKYSDTDQRRGMLSADNYAAFKEAVQGNKHWLVDLLLKYADPDQRREMLNVDNYAAFKKAVQNGDERSSIVDSLLKYADANQRREMISEDNYAAFKEAVQGNKHWLVDLLLKYADPDQRREMLNVDNYAAFKKAVQNGDERSSIVDSLLKYADANQRREMLSANNYAAFKEAMQSDDRNPHIVKSLLKYAQADQQKTMLNNVDYVGIFKESIECGDSSILNSLLGYADTDQRQKMLRCVDYVTVFKEAEQRFGDFHGVLIIASLLEGGDTEQRKAIVNTLSPDDYAAFRELIRGGSRWVLVDELLKYASADQRLKMLSANNYEPFKEAVQHEDRNPMVYVLLKHANEDQRREMLSANDYAAFKVAMLGRRIELLLKLLKYINAEQLEGMLKVTNIKQLVDQNPVLREIFEKKAQELNQPQLLELGYKQC